MATDQEKLEALLNPDPKHIYSDDELDAIEAIDVELACRLDRVQTLAQQAVGNEVSDAPIDEDQVKVSIAEARNILSQDGGDIEYLRLEGRKVVVQLKGACVGCPRSTLDLKNVVERLVRSKNPGVAEVVNTF